MVKIRPMHLIFFQLQNTHYGPTATTDKIFTGIPLLDSHEMQKDSMPLSEQ